MSEFPFGTTITFSSILLATYIFFKFLAIKKRAPPSSVSKSSFLDKSKVKGIEKVQAVDPSFDWKTEEPVKQYPFKNAAYKLTMGIKNLTVQDWLLIDSDYLRKLKAKKEIVTNNHPFYPKEKQLTDKTVLITEECWPAVRELYDVVIQYLVDKYPMYFVVDPAKGTVHNKITDETHPYTADSVPLEDTKELLFKLSQNIEEDFIILLKDPLRESEKDGSEYFFKGGVFAFAAGFAPSDRFNMPLSFVHHPIPGYESKLKLSMNRFFDRVSPGQYVTRMNFSVQTHDRFYVDDQNKSHNLKEGEETVVFKKEDLDFDNQVHYRSERQTLTKLPKTGAVVFTIRTFLIPMSKLKLEGPEVSERFIGAIKGFPDDIADYKRSVAWGPAVIDYLEL